jgi:hypothetical protein
MELISEVTVIMRFNRAPIDGTADYPLLSFWFEN